MNDSQDVLERACAAAGLHADGARLLRVGSNSVYRLKAPIIARVSRPGADAGHVRRTVAIARWLESVGYPAVRVVDVEQPVVIDGHVVTFWEAVSEDGDQYASVAEVAEVLLRLHQLTVPADLHLPELAPFANAPKRIEANTWLTPDDRAFLITMLAQMRAAYAELEFTLPPGVIHGDASIGNVLRDTQGNPVVIDLDGFAIGPREWGPGADRDLLRQLRLARARGIPGLRACLRLRHHDLARLPGHASSPRVLDGHLDHPESPRIRAGRRRSSQAHRGPAHWRQPQGLAALLSNGLVRP
jgi:hypothetical protein